MFHRLIQKWLDSRKQDGWDWAAGRLLLGAHPDKLARYVRTRMTASSSFATGAQAAINEWRLCEMQAMARSSPP